MASPRIHFAWSRLIPARCRWDYQPVPAAVRSEPIGQSLRGRITARRERHASWWAPQPSLVLILCFLVLINRDNLSRISGLPNRHVASTSSCGRKSCLSLFFAVASGPGTCLAYLSHSHPILRSRLETLYNGDARWNWLACCQIRLRQIGLHCNRSRPARSSPLKPAQKHK